MLKGPLYIALLAIFFSLFLPKKVSDQITAFALHLFAHVILDKKNKGAMEGIAPNSFTKPVLEKKARPQEQLNCPRCNSTNTKFCYYNNYSLTQPRYFCKTCRRYWTEGGSLRNIPVGGGSRKNKKITSASSSSSSSSSKVPDLNPPSHQNPTTMQGGQDLNLGYGQFYVENSSSAAPTSSLSALELLRTGMVSRGLNHPYAPSLMPNSYSLYPSSAFPMQESTKPNLGFSVDGLGNRSYNYDEVQENNNGGRVLLPFGDVKQLSSGTEVVEQNKEQGNSTGFWTGMIGEGSW